MLTSNTVATTFTAPPLSSVHTGHRSRPQACKIPLVMVIKHTQQEAMPNTCKWGVAAAAVSGTAG